MSLPDEDQQAPSLLYANVAGAAARAGFKGTSEAETPCTIASSGLMLTACRVS